MSTTAATWVPGAGIAHPTGGYDDYVREAVPGPEMTRENYLRHGSLHNADGPAAVIRHVDGTVLQESYFLDGIEKRLDGGPTQMSYGRGGVIERERWRVGTDLHRTDGPASIDYRPDGSIRHAAWNEHGLLHRIDGPAVTDYSNSGKVTREVFYLRGRELDPGQWSDFREAIEAGAPAEWAIAYVEGRTS